MSSSKISFKDFVPQVTKRGSATTRLDWDFQTLEDALKDANAWIAQHQVKILNVETIVLPNLHDVTAHMYLGHSPTVNYEFNGPGDGGSSWRYQFIRVWYQP